MRAIGGPTWADMECYSAHASLPPALDNAAAPKSRRAIAIGTKADGLRATTDEGSPSPLRIRAGREDTALSITSTQRSQCPLQCPDSPVDSLGRSASTVSALSLSLNQVSCSDQVRVGR